MTPTGARTAVLVVGLWLSVAIPDLDARPGQAAESGGSQDQAGHGDAAAPSGAEAGDAADPTGRDAQPLQRPAITDADRAAAFPVLESEHAVHGEAVRSFVLVERLEWQRGDGARGGAWESSGWIGGDLNRFWFRTEGEGRGGRLADAHAHALFGRAIHPWWDIVVGVRQDVRPGPARTWAVVGLQGLAPYWFEVEATAYVGGAGRTHVHLETEYELLLTNRLVLQPIVEVDLHGTSDPERGIGRGLSAIEGGLRLRYEIRREVAPYVGMTWTGTFFGTADRARAAGEATAKARLALGLRTWF